MLSASLVLEEYLVGDDLDTSEVGKKMINLAIWCVFLVLEGLQIFNVEYHETAFSP